MATEIKETEGLVILKEDQKLFASDSVGVVKGVNKEKRQLTIIASDETRDREGDIIKQNGWNIENYKRNPVFLWAHNYASVPLAAAVKIRKTRNPEPSLILTHQFPSHGLNPFADMILELYNEKTINAGSVGFIPYDFKEIEKDESTPRHQVYGRMFTKAELLEHSGCAVPSNPSAVQNAIKSMDVTEANKELVYKAVTSNDYLLTIDQVPDAHEQLQEIMSKGLEEEEDTSVSVQVPVDIDGDKIDVSAMGEKSENSDSAKSEINNEDNLEYYNKEELVELSELTEKELEILEAELSLVEKFELTFIEFVDEYIGDSFDKEIDKWQEKLTSYVKAGAVLNAKNKARLNQAYDNIRQVLSDAGVDVDNTGQESVENQGEKSPTDLKNEGEEPSVYDLALEPTEGSKDKSEVSGQQPKSTPNPNYSDDIKKVNAAIKEITKFVKSVK